MNKKTRLALEKSIRHWRDNLERAKEGKAFSIDGKNCALCNLFFDPRDFTCGKCPVAKYTGKNNCCGTPWFSVARSTVVHRAHIDEIVGAVTDELDFLISLRPRKTK